MTGLCASTIFDRHQRPLRDLRISVIDRCNLRCPYCMPAEKFGDSYKFLKHSEWLQFDEIIRLGTIFHSLGVNKFRLTGGEPLLRPDLADLVKGLSDIDSKADVALTTNGLWLAEQIGELKRAGLKRLTVSLDSLNKDIYHRMTGGRAHVRRVLDGIREAEAVGMTNIKINAVVQKGINDRCVMDLVEYFRPTGHVVRFIEFMDVGNQNGWKLERVVPGRDIIKMIHERYPLEVVEGPHSAETARRYRFRDGMGEIGIICSVTEPFCTDCTRMRLSADGKIYTCLFSSAGTDLRALLRGGVSDDELTRHIRAVWGRRADRYSEDRRKVSSGGASSPKIEMFYIGG